jgi:hypothetical protein
MPSYTRYRLCVRLCNGSELAVKALFLTPGEARWAALQMYQDRKVQSVRMEDEAGAYRENIDRYGRP